MGLPTAGGDRIVEPGQEQLDGILGQVLQVEIGHLVREGGQGAQALGEFAHAIILRAAATPDKGDPLKCCDCSMRQATPWFSGKDIPRTTTSGASQRARAAPRSRTRVDHHLSLWNHVSVAC